MSLSKKLSGCQNVCPPSTAGAVMNQVFLFDPRISLNFGPHDGSRLRHLPPNWHRICKSHHFPNDWDGFECQAHWMIYLSCTAGTPANFSPVD